MPRMVSVRLAAILAVMLVLALAGQASWAQAQVRRTGICQLDCLHVFTQCMADSGCRSFGNCRDGTQCVAGRCRGSGDPCGLPACAVPCIQASGACRAGCIEYFPSLRVIPQLALKEDIVRELMGDVLAAEEAVDKTLQSLPAQARPALQRLRAKIEDYESKGAMDGPVAEILKQEIARAEETLSIRNLRNSIRAGSSFQPADTGAAAATAAPKQ